MLSWRSERKEQFSGRKSFDYYYCNFNIHKIIEVVHTLGITLDDVDVRAAFTTISVDLDTRSDVIVNLVRYSTLDDRRWSRVNRSRRRWAEILFLHRLGIGTSLSVDRRKVRDVVVTGKLDVSVCVVITTNTRGCRR